MLKSVMEPLYSFFISSYIGYKELQMRLDSTALTTCYRYFTERLKQEEKNVVSPTTNARLKRG